LGNGNIEKPVEVTAQLFSKAAVEKLEKAGGKAIFQC
jgi:ribosomal protein L15